MRELRRGVGCRYRTRQAGMGIKDRSRQFLSISVSSVAKSQGQQYGICHEKDFKLAFSNPIFKGLVAFEESGGPLNGSNVASMGMD